ncbi:MAG: alpha/beta hydrolase [Aeoliella sp.]
MRSPLFFLLLAVALFTLAQSESLAAGEELKLWPATHPANQGPGESFEEVRPNRLVIRHSPSIIPFLPTENSSGAAVMICPGGGYAVLAIDHEGFEIARWMNERGIAAFILKYRCGGSPNTHPAPLDDALRGMQMIRARANEWNIDPEKIGVMGFSAGGHLAASLSTLSTDGQSDAEDPVARLSSRPAFSVLAYPVISMEPGRTSHGGSRNNLLGKNPEPALILRMSANRQISDETPPTFLLHATDDGAVPVANSLLYYQALVEAKVPAELHVFEQGGHGFGMRQTGKPVDHWPALLDRWLRERGLAK